MSGGAAGILMRIRTDLARTDRTAEYEGLLRSAVDHGYRLMPLREFDRLRRGGALDTAGRCLALRHDVDIPDPRGNERFHSVEAALGVQATYFFRLRTAAPHAELIRRLLEEGLEVGYHYEEAATVAKRRGLGTREQVLAHAGEIADLFRSNVAAFRARWNPHLDSIASHGDWVNRRLRVTNAELLSAELLDELGLAFDARQADLMAKADAYVSDVARPPSRWKDDYGLADAMRDGRQRIYMLTHERQWHGSPGVNIREDLLRLVDEAAYRPRVRLARSRMTR